MNRVLVLGAGKIGSLIGALLSDSGPFCVHLADFKAIELSGPSGKKQNHLHRTKIDATDHKAVLDYVLDNHIDAIVSALPYYCNVEVAKVAIEADLHYFDLTEDIQVAEQIRKMAQNQTKAFVPQCGLAPGFISILTNHVLQNFERPETVKMRVGALPLHPNNTLKYSLTWSTDGLINEYGNPCVAIEEGKKVLVQPLQGNEIISLDGVEYEAFNTSGGLGSLADSYLGRVKTMNYKTLRYPGHCEKMRLLMYDLKLNEDRPTLKRILEHAIPKTLQDVVLVYAAVKGLKQGEFFEETRVQKIYSQTIGDHQWSAIQISTAAGICAVLDLVMQQPDRYHGFVTQEAFSLDEFLQSTFGQYYSSHPEQSPSVNNHAAEPADNQSATGDR